MKLWQIRAPHFVAGLVSEASIATQAAPILEWTLGKTMLELKMYCRRRAWRLVFVQDF